jgi:hypothetical protein
VIPRTVSDSRPDDKLLVRRTVPDRLLVRADPTNYMALFAFTACEAVTLAITCLFVDGES